MDSGAWKARCDEMRRERDEALGALDVLQGEVAGWGRHLRRLLEAVDPVRAAGHGCDVGELLKPLERLLTADVPRWRAGRARLEAHAEAAEWRGWACSLVGAHLPDGAQRDALGARLEALDAVWSAMRQVRESCEVPDVE